MLISKWLDENASGCLNQMDVYNACNEATYNIDLEEYIEGEKEKYEDEFNDYIEELKQEYKEDTQDMSFDEWLDYNGYEKTYDEWFEKEKREELEESFNDARTGDDYAPLWLTAWMFPSSYSAEELNEEYRHSGIIFFEINGNLFVSLTCCGMDMSPILYYAFFMDAGFDDEENIKEILYGIQRKGLSYYKYVIGEKRINHLIDAIGEKRVRLAQNISERKYKEFDETLEKLTEARDKGDLSSAETGLLGILAFLKSQKNEIE